MKALIDADVLVYSCAFACQRKTDGGLELKGAEEVNDLVDRSIKDIVAAVYSTEPPTLYLTGSGNFRFKAAKSRPYKGNRKQLKPHYYSYIRAYLQNVWGAEVINGMEADDALAIHQTSRIRQQDTIICSIDKDLRQVEGWHYSWESGRSGSKGPDWVDSKGHLKLKGPKKLIGSGNLFFYSQLLTGDSTDTYDGLPGCGPIGAFKILEGAETEEEMYSRVLEAYVGKYGEEASERLYEQAQLAWMVRHTNEDGSPVFWEAPSYLESK